MDRNIQESFCSPGAQVVPYVGTWIEMTDNQIKRLTGNVVPYVGTWIEIQKMAVCRWIHLVVPYVGTWIEIGVH